MGLDQRRLEAVREARRRQAEQYFDERAYALGQRARSRRRRRPWSRRRCTTCSPAERPASLLDIGTGTGRILQVLAGQVGFGLGVDLSHDMLAVARANLDQREARNCQVRHGDMYQLPLPDALVRRRRRCIRCCTSPTIRSRPWPRPRRVLAPGGRLVVVDLAPHGAGAAARRAAGIAGSASATRRSAAGSPSSAWSQEPPRRLAGPELTVVIWTRPAPARLRADATNA